MLGTIVTLASLALSGYQTYAGWKSAQEAEEERKRIEAESMAKFEVSPEMRLAYQRALEESKYGLSPEERAYAQQQIAIQTRKQQRMATDIAGGQIAPAVATALKGKEMEAEADLAAKSALLRYQKGVYAGQMAQPFQAVSEMETQRQLAERQRRLQYNLLQQQAAGGAMQTGIENIGRTAWHQAALEAYKQKPIGGEEDFTGEIAPGALQSWYLIDYSQYPNLYSRHQYPYSY